MLPELDDLLAQWCEATSWTADSCRVEKQFVSASGNGAFLISRGHQNFVAKLWNDLPETMPRSWKADSYSSDLAVSAGLSPRILYQTQCPRASIMEYVGEPRRDTITLEETKTLAVALANLHALEFETECVPRHEYLDLIDRYQSMLSDQQRVDLRPMLTELKVLARTCFHGFDPVLCHHDLTRGNILWKQGQPFLIDWEYACQGSRLFDLATVSETYSFSEESEAEMIGAYTQAGVGEIEELLTDLPQMRRFVCLLEKLWAAAISNQT